MSAYFSTLVFLLYMHIIICVIKFAVGKFCLQTAERSVPHIHLAERFIQAFKLLHNMYDADYTTFFDKASGSTTRGHSFNLKTTYSRINCRANFFSVNVVGDWNSLPKTVVNSTSLNQFKGSLDRHLRAEMFVLI